MQVVHTEHIVQVLKRNSRFGYVAIEREVYRVPLRALQALEGYIDRNQHDEIHETMQIIRTSAKCPLICELDLVLGF